MPTKRKNTVDIFPIEPRNVPNQKQESDEIIKRYMHKQLEEIILLLLICEYIIGKSLNSSDFNNSSRLKTSSECDSITCK